MDRVLLASGNDEWTTPIWLFRRALLRWGPFDVDACANASNALCPVFWNDADKRDWSSARVGRVWCNPPYSRKAKRAILDKALEADDLSAVFLLPARTGTTWFAQVADRASEIVFLTHRVKFGGAESGAPFPSALVRVTPERAPRHVTFEAWR